MKKHTDQPSPVDEQYLMEVIAGGFSTKGEAAVSQSESDSMKQLPKSEPEEKNRKSNLSAKSQVNTEDYESTFLRRNELKQRQSVYISKEIHEKVSRIVSVLGGRELSVGGYIDNVLSQHFEAYLNEISTLYDNKYQKLFK